MKLLYNVFHFPTFKNIIAQKQLEKENTEHSVGQLTFPFSWSRCEVFQFEQDEKCLPAAVTVFYSRSFTNELCQIRVIC